ncbi:MAG: hypothetical protein AUH43_08550 [Acidobacteria bacterium 13_1_40CM_65_14]|nr:MAG: hypothetical protein AUH43_08550 [Acidobacteria bacterium 13_1_40CM_65_14]
MAREKGVRPLFVAGIAAAGAALLVVQWAAARPLWLDEELLAINVRDRAIPNYLEALWLGQTAPFGWLVLERLVVLTLGTGERALRLLPVLFGVATIATAVWIGRRWMTAIGAPVLVILCACSQWLTFYFLELKSYSADAFFGLLVPAMAAWSIEECEIKNAEFGIQNSWREFLIPNSTFLIVKRTLRPAVFWIVAAIAQWFANGALFVTPACALMLAAMIARRDGWRSLVRFSAFGLVWLASFALNYAFVLRHASSSAYLQRVWAFALPPSSAGVWGVLHWFGTQLAAFGVKPGSTRFGVFLWLAAGAGFIAGAATHRRVAVFFATVPLSAMLLAALGLVPFYERLTLWIVPALYVGVAFLADAAWMFLNSRRSLGRPIAAVVGLCVAIVICGDVVVRGLRAAIVRAQARNENRGHDDRSAVQWLNVRKQSDDIWMTTHYGTPAIWWYAGLDGQHIVDVAYAPEGPECRRDELTESVADAPRVLLYLGFRYDDVPAGFDDLLVGRLSALGSVTAYRSFADQGHALIIDRRVTPGAPTTLSRLDLRTSATRSAIDGCFTRRIADVSTFVQ